jgi:Ferritin-like
MRGRRYIDLSHLVPMEPIQEIRLGATPPGGKPLDRIRRPPEMNPRDWCVFLLHCAAEVEHALMVQYLYAMYSLRENVEIPDDPAGNTTDSWVTTFTGIAMEEMGHLLTVQNLLRLIGGALCLDREDFPLRSQFYPFPFTLEKLTKGSLAKYVFAEMTPGEIPSDIVKPKERDEITAEAEKAAGVAPASANFINHVGTLYNTITWTFANELAAGDLRTDRSDWQSRKWQRTNERTADLLSVKLMPATNKTEALHALDVIARQGEAFDPATPDDSHFQRFLPIYRACPKDSTKLTWHVLTNPTCRDDAPSTSQITNKGTRLWALLFDLRYRVLLTSLVHATAVPAANAGLQQTPIRKTLMNWIYLEMKAPPQGSIPQGSIKDLAKKLATMAATDKAEPTAGAPFELPYSLSIPDHGPERWRLHLDLIDSTKDLIAAIRAESGDDPLLDAILKRDGATTADGRRKDIAENQNSPI